MFAPSLNFNGRNRRPPRDPVDAVSLGYTMLHAECVLQLYGAGLDPRSVGPLHELDFGRESLCVGTKDRGAPP